MNTNIAMESGKEISRLRCNKTSNKRFSIAQKLEILKKLDTEITITELADEYNVSRAAIYKIKNNRENLLKFAANISSKSIVDKKRATNRLPFYEILDEIIYSWVCQNQQQGTQISGPQICETALEVNQMIGGPDTFKASQGWLTSFKNRHGMKKIKVQENEFKLPTDTSGIEEFEEDYAKFVKDRGYKVENIFFGDEAGFNWKSLPKNLSVSSKNESCYKNESIKERVSILLCANADGSCRLPPLVIGPSKKPRCLKGNRILPVTYATQKSAKMDQEIFTDWYKNNFIPFVKSQQKTRDKVLLLLDDCRAHPSAEDLNAVDPQFCVKYLHSNNYSVIQSMHRHIIGKTKVLYRKNLLRLMATAHGRLEDPDMFWKNFELIDGCYMIASTWQELSQSDLAKAWYQSKLLGDLSKQNTDNFYEQNSGTTEIEDEIINSESIDEFKNIIEKIPACANCNEEDIKIWLKEDLLHQGWEPLELKNIVHKVIAEKNIKFPSHDLYDNLKNESLVTNEDNESNNSNDMNFATTNHESMDLDYMNFVSSDDTADTFESDSQNPLADSISNEKFNFNPSDEDALKAAVTIRRWCRINSKSNEKSVAKHLETLKDIECYIKNCIISNSNNTCS